MMGRRPLHCSMHMTPTNTRIRRIKPSLFTLSMILSATVSVKSRLVINLLLE